MWEWALIAGIVIVGLVVWQVARGSGGARASRDGDAGTTVYATDGNGYSTSTSYGRTDTGNECSTDSSNDGGSGSCDGGGGDGGGGGD